jgi:hypothetical protein
MPILTKNETPTKGQKAEFQLDKAALAALSSVSSDIYFSDIANWKQVELVYVSPIGRQRKVVKFDATQAAPVGDFFASEKSQNEFEIQYIMINDFDGGEFKVLRSELTVAEFDIDMGSVTPPASCTYIIYNINSYGYIVSPTGGVTSGSVFYGDDQFIKSSINQSVGDFEYQWDFNWTGIDARNMILGITTSGKFSFGNPTYEKYPITAMITVST